MNIRFYNHYAITPNFPGGTRHYELAKALAEKGYEPSVFASGFNYSSLQETQDYGDEIFVEEKIDGIVWVWVKTHPYTKNDLHRFRNMLSYAKHIRSLKDRAFDMANVIVGSTVHPFGALAASSIAKWLKIPFVFEIRDLWPQTMIDNGIWTPKHPGARIFKRIEKKTIKNSAAVIALSPLTKDYLKEEYGFPQEKVLLLPNGTGFKPAVQKNDFENNKLKLMYLGGIDKVHQLEDLFKALAKKKELQDKVDVIMVGKGKEAENLKKLESDLQLQNVEWRGVVPKSQVEEVLQEADVLFLSTSHVLYGSENKLAEYLMSGRPIITYTPAKHNDPVEELDCGISAKYDDVDDLAKNIETICGFSKEELNRMGKNGQKFAMANLSWDKLSEKLIKFVKEEVL